MTLYLLLAISAIFALRGLVDWRKGLLLMVLLAAFQDPLRKLVPGTPGWLVLLTAPIFLAALFASTARTRRWWGGFRSNYKQVATAMLLLALLCLPAAAISATYSEGSWKLTLLGVFSYALVFLAVILGYHYARSMADVRRLLVIYCLVHGVMLSGAFMEYFQIGPATKMLGTEALGYKWIRWGSGYTVDMIAGFYRSADVMGWHAAAVSMLSLALGITARGRKRKLWILLSVVAAGALMLCGRRKMVFMLPIFVLALMWVYWQAGRQSRVAVMMGILLIPIGSAWFVGDVLTNDSANLRYYSGEGIEESVLSRIEVHGFKSIVTTFRQSGFFGEGLGVATPGSHNLAVERPRIWQESTGSRILVELGVPGALGFLLVMVAILAGMWRETVKLVRSGSTHGHYAACLMAFFLANVGSLVVSGQILADPFIAALLGLLVGIVLSLSKLPEQGAKGRPKAPDRRPYEPVVARKATLS